MAPWTPERDQIVRDGYANGTPVRQLAAQLGCGTSSITRRAQALGVTTTAGDQVRAAVAAKQLTAKQRRTAVLDRLYTRAETVLTRLEADTFTTLTMSAGSQLTQELTFVPPQDERHLSSSISTYLASAERIEKLDADAGTVEAVGMLDRIADAIKAAADTIR